MKNWILLIGFSFLSSYLFAQSNSPESQIFYGPSVKTDEMHNLNITGRYDPNVYGMYANSWFKKYTLTVSAPSGWHFVGDPYVNCVTDNQGAFGWNNFPAAHDRFFVTQRNASYIEATCWAGSRSITINLACKAIKD